MKTYLSAPLRKDEREERKGEVGRRSTGHRGPKGDSRCRNNMKTHRDESTEVEMVAF